MGSDPKKPSPQGVKRQKNVSPYKAIRSFCLECVGGSSNEVKRCCAFNCKLWPLRMGTGVRTLAEKSPELLDPEHIRQQHKHLRGKK